MRYFFNVYDSSLIAIDDEGLDLPSIETARKEATRGALSILAEELRCTGCLRLAQRIEVEDEDHLPVFTLPFKAAVHIQDEGPEAA